MISFSSISLVIISNRSYVRVCWAEYLRVARQCGKKLRVPASFRRLRSGPVILLCDAPPGIWDCHDRVMEEIFSDNMITTDAWACWRLVQSRIFGLDTQQTFNFFINECLRSPEGYFRCLVTRACTSDLTCKCVTGDEMWWQTSESIRESAGHQAPPSAHAASLY